MDGHLKRLNIITREVLVDFG
jgi:WD40 repeat protein